MLNSIKITLVTLLFTLCCLSFTQDITLNLGKAIGEVPPLAIKGVNHGTIAQILGSEDKFAPLNLGAIRYPPGNIADDYPLDKTLIDAFELHWILLDKLPILAVPNLFEGTPEDAVAAARYFKELEIPVLAWEIGNEPDLYAHNRGDPSWTPEKYCEHFRAFSKALKTEDPEYLLAGPGTSGAAQGSAPEGYLQEVLRLCGDAIDILTWHIYTTNGTLSDEEALATYSVVGGTIDRYRSWLKDPEINPLGHEKDIPVAITEFGLSWKTDNYRHLFDIVATLWLADALGQMATKELDMGFYFALKDTGGHGLIGTDGFPRPTYYVFDLLKDFTGQILELGGTTPDLHAYAVKDEEKLQLLLVNIAAEDISLELNSPEQELTELTLSILSETTYNQYYDFETDIAYAISTQPASDLITVPARSIVFITAPCSE